MHFIGYKESQGLKFKDRILENSPIPRSESTAPCCALSLGTQYPSSSHSILLTRFCL